MLATDTLSGFALGLSLLLAFGAQNVFVLRQGIAREYVFSVVMICAVSDAVLVSIGVGGFTWIVSTVRWIEPVLIVGGALFLFTYGTLSAWSAMNTKAALVMPHPDSSSFRHVMITCLALTWLNPHVYLDTVILMGSVSTQQDSKWLFAAGAIFASFVFFFVLGFGARVVSSIFSTPTAWRILEGLVALVMWGISMKLILSAT